MANVVVTHLGVGSDFHGQPHGLITLNELGSTLHYGTPVHFSRSPGDIARMTSLMGLRSAGKVSVVVTLTAAETDFSDIFTQLAGSPGGSGSPPTTVVWRENEPSPSGNVYATFVSALAALDGVTGIKTILIDGSRASLIYYGAPGVLIPAGTYDLKGEIEIVCLGSVPVTVLADEGCILVNPLAFRGPLDFESESSTPVIKLTISSTGDGPPLLEITGSANLDLDNGADPILDVLVSDGTGVQISLKDASRLRSVRAVTGRTVFVHQADTSHLSTVYGSGYFQTTRMAPHPSNLKPNPGTGFTGTNVEAAGPSGGQVLFFTSALDVWGVGSAGRPISVTVAIERIAAAVAALRGSFIP